MMACESRWYREHFAYLHFQRFLAFIHSGFKLGIFAGSGSFGSLIEGP